MDEEGPVEGENEDEGDESSDSSDDADDRSDRQEALDRERLGSRENFWGN
jgi:hypothetical protein